MKTGRLLMICGLALLMACGKSSVMKQRGASREMFPDQESWESTIIISRRNRLVARAYSRRMIKYENRQVAHLLGDVKVDFYNEQGQHVSLLLADSAEFHLKTHKLSANGNVIIHSDSGLVLLTERLDWNDQYDMLYTNDSVTFASNESDTLYGIGFESDVDLTHWKIFHPRGVTERQFGESE